VISIYSIDMAISELLSPNSYQYAINRQDWAIDRWCRGFRISRKKLETHPYFEDVATLLMFDEWQTFMTTTDKDIWRHCWQWSYHKELPLSGYHKGKLVGILDHIELRQIRQYHIEKRLQKRLAKSASCEIGKRELHNDDNRSRSLGLVATDPDHECVVDGLSLAG